MSKTPCFHCGLPIDQSNINTKNAPPSVEVLQLPRQFCCYGCKAVCQAIVESGNEDYYEYRETHNKTASAENIPELLKQFKLYDKAEIQRDFVRTGDSWKEAWLILEEIRCAACMWLNERTLRQLNGVLDVQMDYTGQQTRVRWDPSKIQLSDILQAISTIGYIAHPFDPQHREALNKEQQLRSLKRIIFTIILGMMVMQTAISSYFYGNPLENGEYPLWIRISRWTSLIVTGFILAYPGQLFFRNAWRDLKNKTLGMDVPIALGLSVAWLGSFLSTVLGKGEVYYESIAMFVLLILIARHLELRARITATALLDRNSKIIPASAQKIVDGSIQEVAVIELNKGDRVRVLPGETVPVDAILQSQQSSFDESLLSGEVLPVHHKLGGRILGGSINVEQAIEIEVATRSSESTLSNIQQLTQHSVNSRPYYIDLAENMASKFVAVILLIAIATLVYWLQVDPSHALGHMISVLIVTCPCALALASPVALSLCAAGLLKLKVLAIRLSAIEEMSKVDTVVFDKTGTLTQGKPQLESIVTFGKLTETDYLFIAASMEKDSEHPFSKALVQACENKRNSLNASHDNDHDNQLAPLFEVKTLQNFPGQGIEAVINNQEHNEKWRLGSDKFVRGALVDVVDEEDEAEFLKAPQKRKKLEALKERRKQGFSIVYLSNDQGIQAVFCLDDPLREGISEFLTELSSLITHSSQHTHKPFVILSGDHQQSVDQVANTLSISNAHGGMLPTDKLSWIQQKQKDNHIVMMLGDGINDAPTLAQANVSMSFSDATDLAQQHSDFTLLKTNYQGLAPALVLMLKTRRIIIQNLSWAIIYNALAIPAAVLGWITPWMAAFGMSLSSFIVVLNSLRLRK